MIIERTKNTIIIRAKASDNSYAKIGVTETYLMIGGNSRKWRRNTKPHDEITMADCDKLLTELQELVVDDYRTALLRREY